MHSFALLICSYLLAHVMWSQIALVVALLALFDNSCVHSHIGKQMWPGEICVGEQIVLLGADRPIVPIAPMHY